MIGELSILSEWIPEQMEPGTIFVLENAGDVGDKDDPYWAVLSCPKCGQLGLVTRKQIAGLVPVICGSDKCPAQFFIRDEANRVAEGELVGLVQRLDDGTRDRVNAPVTLRMPSAGLTAKGTTVGRALLFG